MSEIILENLFFDKTSTGFVNFTKSGVKFAAIKAKK